MRAALTYPMMFLMLAVAMLLFAGSPAPAQIRLFKDGQIIKIGPTKAERRARQAGVMMGAMSGRHPAPGQNRPPGAAVSQPAQDQSITPAH